MASFGIFAAAVRKRFEEMSQDPLFEVAAGRDEIWDRYLTAYPEGTNPIFRTRREHDCSCCRAFIRSTGTVVAIQNGALASIWDLNGLPEPFQTVAAAMAAYVKALPVKGVFLTRFTKHGTALSRELIDGHAHEWRHFALDIPPRFITQDVGEKRSEAQAAGRSGREGGRSARRHGQGRN